MELKSLVKNLWEAGYTVTQISSKLKVSAGTVCSVLTEIA